MLYLALLDLFLNPDLFFQDHPQHIKHKRTTKMQTTAKQDVS